MQITVLMPVKGWVCGKINPFAINHKNSTARKEDNVATKVEEGLPMKAFGVRKKK